VYNYVFFCDFSWFFFVVFKVKAFLITVPFFLWKSAYTKFSKEFDILSHNIRIETDITVLFSDLVSLNISSQTWNVKYYKYAIIKNGLKSLIIDLCLAGV